MIFPTCGNQPIGLYPIVDSVTWLEKLLPLGITTIQLRIKNPSQIENEIQEAVTLARKFSARLFINDFWEPAIEYQAYGVHLGQEDLDTADLEKIYRAGLRLGISTHCKAEVERALILKPSYIACGPIYPTTSKVMPFEPQGIEKLKHWKNLLPYPIVAIGGINLARMPEVAATGVDGIAVISAITGAKDPIGMTRKLMGYAK
jgi:hydroxymethylpyrimidine kinase / phosphomethylpyrimidine kinase / thiamine-phosphate diphosphorylase